MDNSKISVIVPVYNVEQYLPRCIDSILAQTFTDFEVLLIDDGSTDSSGNICDEYAKKDNRIRVFHKENGGVSSARNVGLDNAIGEWICFVDSDDAIELDFFSNCIDNEKEYIDIIFCSWIFVKHGRLIKKYKFDDIIYQKDIDIHNFFTDINVINLGVPWGKLYRKRIITEHNIRFDLSLSISEDKLFFYQFLIWINAIQLKSYVGYIYYCSNQGLSSKVYDFNTNNERYIKLNNAAQLIRHTFHLTAMEYFPFWHQQLIYLSLLFNSNSPHIINPFIRIKLDKDIYIKNFASQYLIEAGNSFIFFSLLRQKKIRLIFIINKCFFLYELHNLCKHLLKHLQILRKLR